MKNLLSAFMCDRQLVKLFTNCFFDYRKIEKSIVDDLSSLSYFEEIEIKKLSPTDGFAKNFFTLFMISLLKDSGIEKNKLISYGKIIYFLRAIVTAVDNLIDNEEKGVIFFNSINEKNSNNSLISLQMQNLLTNEIYKLAPQNGFQISNNLMDDLYIIARSESLRCRDDYLEYPKYKFILDNINSGIGGKLLKIGLTVPCLIEENEKLNKFSNILFDMGVELQALDDLCDMKEDYDNNKTNLATAYFFENTNLSEDEVVNLDIEDNKEVKGYLKLIIENVFASFRQLKEIGYPINERDGKILLERLFELRGLKKEWNIFIGED